MTLFSKIQVTLFCAFAMCTAFSSCLSSNEEAETIYTHWQDATITSFSLENNKDVCANLSGYKFTIDNFGKSDPELAAEVANAGIIFNPDSLPTGTIADSIKIDLGYHNASSILFKQYDIFGDLMKVVNYEDTQVVSFDDYAVTRLDVTSYDGTHNKSYFVKINIHKTYGDTIRWQYLAQDLWPAIEIVNQKVDTIGSELLWFNEYNNGKITVRRSDLHANVKNWSAETDIDAEERPIITTTYTLSNVLYAVGENGSLVATEDGDGWHIANDELKFVSILGLQYSTKKYNAHLHAVINDEGTYKFARSFDGKTWEKGEACPAEFPVRNFSNPISEKANPSAGNVTSRLYIVGGEKADGTYTASTWSCDGNSWAEFEQSILPAMTRPAIIRYTTDIDKPESLWILWPGSQADGKVVNTPYFSENRGVTWKLLNSEYKALATTTPINATGAVSAFVNPKTYWMYFFGGVDADGKQKADVFGGQLKSLIFDKKR